MILYGMTNGTRGTKLPRKLEQKMQNVGEQIKLARLHRDLSITQVAERAACSPLTVMQIEIGMTRLLLEFIFGYSMHCNWTMTFFGLLKMMNLVVISRI